MKTYALLASAMLLLFSLGGCMQRNCDCDPDPLDYPPVVFQYEYINYAWGYRHHGFLIDSKGKVWGFGQPEKWTFPDTSGYMTRIGLEYNLALCDTLCGSVELKELQEQYSKIPDIQTGTIKDHGQVMFDAGLGVFTSWIWNEKMERYEPVFLISNGDVFRENSHPATSKVVEWLKSIGENTNRFYWYGQN